MISRHDLGKNIDILYLAGLLVFDRNALPDYFKVIGCVLVSSINEILRKLPKVDELIDDFCARMPQIPRVVIKQSIQQEIDIVRREVLAGNIQDFKPESLEPKISDAIAEKQRQKLLPVINATGVVLHTNLGRAPLSRSVANRMAEVSTGYSNLEFNLETGSRGERYDHVEELICALTGAESAVVVNNNAAAVLIALTCLAQGKEVVVSRGELVEIGGSFRVPDVMEAGGCILCEVGTTNKTKVSDYRNAINENTAALLKVHTSNYKIIGFTETVELSELYELGKEENLPVMYDLGCGLLCDLQSMGIGTEPTVSDCVPYADILCFSGDKLLGGPQTGIIAGKSEYISAIKKHQLLRALRVDKLTLSALELTLREYLDPEKALREIPTLSMITQPLDEIKDRAERLISSLAHDISSKIEIVETLGQVGGGTMPEVTLPSFALSITPENFGLRADKLSKALRSAETPVIGRTQKDALLLDMRTVTEAEIAALSNSLTTALKGD